MKILFLMNHIIMGGLEKVLLQYMDVLCARGVKCTVLVKTKVTDEYFLNFFKGHNIKVIEIIKTESHSHVKKRMNRWLIWLRFWWHVNVNNAVVDFANFSFLDELRNVKKRKIGYCHGSILFFNAMIDKSVLDVYDDIVCLSDSFKRDFIKQYPQYANKIHHIYNPIDVENVRKLSKCKINCKKPYFVAVQRLDSVDKDVATVIHAFDIFSKRYPGYYLYIVGDGPQREELERLSQGNENIIFVGKIDNPYPFIRGANALILSSTATIGEGLPNTLLEAQALGTLAISSDVPSGPHEILMDGMAGLLFKQGDYKSLTKILADVASKKYHIEKIIKNATDNMTRFNALKNVEKLLELIHDSGNHKKV